RYSWPQRLCPCHHRQSGRSASRCRERGWADGARARGMTAPAFRSSIFHDFLHSEASGGILLMFAAALAMLVANSPWADGYFHGLHVYLGPLSLLHWINDGLMALFLLLVGLEIKREFV